MNGFKTIGDLFDDTITRIFGVDFDSLFSSNLSNGQKVIKRSYTDPRGNVATTITRGNGSEAVTKCYVNGEERDFLPDAIARALEEVTPVVTSTFDIIPFKIGNKLPDPLVRGTDFPVLDIFLLEDRSMKIRVALAGVDPDRVGLSFANEYLKLKIEPETSKGKEIKKAVLVKGIKNSDGGYVKEIYIDPTKYDIKGLSFEHKNGIMEIRIPGAAIAEKPTLVFKAATSKPAEEPATKETDEKGAEKSTVAEEKVSSKKASKKEKETEQAEKQE